MFHEKKISLKFHAKEIPYQIPYQIPFKKNFYQIPWEKKYFKIDINSLKSKVCINARFRNQRYTNLIAAAVYCKHFDLNHHVNK